MAPATNFLALDVGEKRIGVALARATVRIASPLTTLDNDAVIWSELVRIIERETVGTVIIGLPRGLEGQETSQTTFCRQFAADLVQHFNGQIALQDEALTSVKAEQSWKPVANRIQKSLSTPWPRRIYWKTT